MSSKLTKIKKLVQVIKDCQENPEPISLYDGKHLDWNSPLIFRKCEDCEFCVTASEDSHKSCMDLFYEKVEEIINGK